MPPCKKEKHRPTPPILGFHDSVVGAVHHILYVRLYIPQLSCHRQIELQPASSFNSIR